MVGSITVIVILKEWKKWGEKLQLFSREEIMRELRKWDRESGGNWSLLSKKFYDKYLYCLDLFVNNDI